MNLGDMDERPSYRQTRSLDNIGESTEPMSHWYRNTNHLIFINENMTLVNDVSSSSNEIIER